MYQCLSNDVEFSRDIIKNWQHTFIYLLTTEGFFVEATQVMNHSAIEEIREMNTKGTFLHSKCGRCKEIIQAWNKDLENNPDLKKAWCNKCKDNTLICSICAQPVKGLALVCQICGHGGHMKEMKEYFSNADRVCPAGCMHRCFDFS